MKKIFFQPLSLIFLIATVLIVIWFQEGLILGTAESEIPFYNLESFSRLTQYTWTDLYLGRPTSLTIASAPAWWFLSEIQKIGIPGFIIQASVFWLILVLSGTGMYKLVETLFPGLPKKYVILSCLFYWFNPLILVNVWNRFLYNYLVFYSILPFLTYLYIKGLEKRKYLYAVVIPLFLAFFSYALTGYVFNLLILFLFAFSSIFRLLTNFKKDFFFFLSKYNLIILSIFLVVNSWWILPTSQFLQSKDTGKELSLFVNGDINFSTLNTLSLKLGHLTDIMRFLHIAFYQNEGPAWANTYLSFPLNILLVVISGFVLWGVYCGRKDKWGLYFGSLFLLGIFLAKGNQGPFGIIFEFLFKHVPVIQIFRDPFEKFAFIISLAAAPLIALSFYELEKKLKGRFKSSLIFLALILMGSLEFPYFTQLIFTSRTPPNDNYSIGYKVKVPEYYKQADEWLTSQGRNYRFIGFPLGNEGITYNWEKGYQGVEAGETLFSISNILFNTSIPYYHQLVNRLEEDLFKGKNFNKIASVLNVKYLMIRSDLAYTERIMRDPRSVEERLNQISQTGDFKKVNQFGKLTFWENVSWVDKTVYPANYLIESRPQAIIDDVTLQEVDERSVIYNNQPSLRLNNLVSSLLIHPENGKYTSSFRTYIFDIEEEGIYELIVGKNIVDGSKLSLDGSNASVSAKVRADERISYGSIYLGKGLHEFTFSFPQAKNLLNTPESIALNSQDKKFQSPINEFDPYSKYMGSFDFLIKSGPGFEFSVEQNKDANNKMIPIYWQFVANDPNFSDWRHAEGEYLINSHPETANLALSAGEDKKSEVVFKNIILTKLPEFNPILKKDRIHDNSLILPKVTYTKINPTKIKVKISQANNPFVLVFSELYHQDWEAKYEDGTKIDQHFMVNSYANGWLIDKNGDFNMTLEFAPQKLLDTGKIISVASFVLGVFYIGIVLLRKKRI